LQAAGTVSRAEYAALVADILGLRVRPAELDTILLAADDYAAAEARRIRQRQDDLDAIGSDGGPLNDLAPGGTAGRDVTAARVPARAR